jgi:hypothetical protein
MNAVRTGTGTSALTDSAAAGRAAAEAALASLTGDPEPALVLVYASMAYDLPVLLAAIRAVTGNAPLVGASASGQFSDGTLIPPGNGVSVLVIAGSAYRFGVGSVSGLRADSAKAGEELARAAMAAAGSRERYSALLVLADGLTGDLQGLLNGIYQVVGATVPVVGGAAAADRMLDKTYVFHDGQVVSDSAVAVWIGGDQPFRVVSAHGWRTNGLPLLVTRVDGQVVQEIDGRPAIDVYRENFRHQDPIAPLGVAGAQGYHTAHAFGLIEPDGSRLIRAALVGDDGQLRTFAPLPPYSAVQIMSGDPDDLLSVSDEVVADALKTGPHNILLTFSCVARMDILRERGDEEAARLQAAAGHVPTFGFYTYGEFARSTSVSGYHNATITALAL